MIDPKHLRHDIEAVATKLAIKGYELDVASITALEAQRKDIQVNVQSLQNDRNVASKKIGAAKAKGEDIQPLLAAVASLGDELKAAEHELEGIQQQLQEIELSIPNIPHESVPAGKTEDDNVEVKTWGTPSEFDFTPKDHVELGEQLGLMDFETATKLTGSRFVILRNKLAKLQRALTQFMLDVHINEHGYNEIYVPYLVNADSLYGTGQLPKFAEDQFITTGEHPFYLIPTAEVPITNTVRDTIIDPEQLPIQQVAHTPCFRSEAGSYGRDTRGMIRQHQFEKVEMVWIVEASQSYDVLEQLRTHAETILEKLNLAYRTVVLCGGDLGNGAAKTYDLEVWLPGQQKYRENFFMQ